VPEDRSYDGPSESRGDANLLQRAIDASERARQAQKASGLRIRLSRRHHMLGSLGQRREGSYPR
jgi:hypothetical protein